MLKNGQNHNFMLISWNKNSIDLFDWNAFKSDFMIKTLQLLKEGPPYVLKNTILYIDFKCTEKNNKPDWNKISYLQELVIFNLSKYVSVKRGPLRVHSSCQDVLPGLVEDPDSH